MGSSSPGLLATGIAAPVSQQGCGTFDFPSPFGSLGCLPGAQSALCVQRNQPSLLCRAALLTWPVFLDPLVLSYIGGAEGEVHQLAPKAGATDTGRGTHSEPRLPLEMAWYCHCHADRACLHHLCTVSGAEQPLVLHSRGASERPRPVCSAARNSQASPALRTAAGLSQWQWAGHMDALCSSMLEMPWPCIAMHQQLWSGSRNSGELLTLSGRLW